MSNSLGRAVERQQLKKKFHEYLHGPWAELVLAQRLQLDAGVKVTMDHKGHRFLAGQPMLPARPRFRQFVKMVKRQLSVMAQLKAEALKAKVGPEAKEGWEGEGDLLVETGPIETEFGLAANELLDEESSEGEPAPFVPFERRAELPSPADVAAIDNL